MKKRSVEPIYEDEVYFEDAQDEVRHFSEPEIVSTSQAINLTCTLGALSSLFALFLYFNDERSRAVRLISVQSLGLGVGYLISVAAILILLLFFGGVPIIGLVINLVLNVSFAAFSLVVVYLKIQMMKRAYRGHAYLLPLVGQWLRRFE